MTQSGGRATTLTSLNVEAGIIKPAGRCLCVSMHTLLYLRAETELLLRNEDNTEYCVQPQNRTD